VEDHAADAELLVMELRRAGYEPDWRRVETAEQLRAALAERAWDLVIFDYVLPLFGPREALRIVRELGLDLPFLIVSGTIDEDNAVEALRAGVHDFMTKGKFARLLPAIERELRDSDMRRKRREAIVLARSPDFDPARVSALLEESRVAELRGRARIEADAVAVLQTLEPDDRAALSEILTRRGRFVVREKGDRKAPRTAP
jgi:DNA-binding NtrC family response regulator